MEIKDIQDFFYRRRSVRRFAQKEIPNEILEILMKIAMAAPSGNNTQPWEFVIARDPKIKEEISRVHPWVHMAKEAAAAIIIMGNRGSEWWKEDCAAATENLLLAAANLGLGTVWCGINLEQAKTVRRILKAPEKMEVLCIVPIGYPGESPPAHTKYRQDKVHWDRY